MKRLSIGLGVLLSFVGSNVELRADSFLSFNDRSGFGDPASWAGTCNQGVSSLSTVSNSGIGLTAEGLPGTGNITYSQQTLSSEQNPSPSDPGCSIFASDASLVEPIWSGNFTVGDGLVWSFDPDTGSGNGPIQLLLDQGVSGIGTQFQDVGYGPFTAELDVYGANDITPLFSFQFDGDSEGTADGSAVFLGILDMSGGANITRAVASIVSCSGSQCDPTDFAINQISLAEPSPPSVGVPEPPSIFLLETGIAGLAWFKLKKNKASQNLDQTGPQR